MEIKEKEALEFYGRNLGLTFQIADDTLDYNSELNYLERLAKIFMKENYTTNNFIISKSQF